MRPTLWIVLVACSSPSTQPERERGPAAVEAGAWARVKASYGVLTTIAGKGATDGRRDEWKAGFEGGAAVEAELSRPHFAMADAAGNVYIADKEAHAIRRVGTDGRIVTIAGRTGTADPVDDAAGPATQRALGNPNGLYVRPDGTVYVLDLDHGRVRKVTPDGVMTTLFEVKGGISIGRGLWVADDESEALVASHHVIKRWTPGGGVTDWVDGFADLGNLARDATGRVLVGDRGGDRVYAVTVDGDRVVKTPIAGTGGDGAPRDGGRALDTPLDGPRAVWPAPDGDGFFVGTHEGCQLWFVDDAGIAHLMLDGERNAHSGDGARFDTPGKKVSELRSVSLDAAGNILIVEDDRGFVRKIERTP